MMRCKNGNLYTGGTNHMIRRWHQHRQGTGAKYLRAHDPEEVVFIEQHLNRSEACKRGYEIKQLSRQEKEALIDH